MADNVSNGNANGNNNHTIRLCVSHQWCYYAFVSKRIFFSMTVSIWWGNGSGIGVVVVVVIRQALWLPEDPRTNRTGINSRDKSNELNRAVATMQKNRVKRRKLERKKNWKEKWYPLFHRLFNKMSITVFSQFTLWTLDCIEIACCLFVRLCRKCFAIVASAS